MLSSLYLLVLEKVKTNQTTPFYISLRRRSHICRQLFFRSEHRLESRDSEKHIEGNIGIICKASDLKGRASYDWKAHISRNSLPKVLQASDSRWLKTCGRPQYLSRPKRRRWYFCQILTVRTFQFGKTCNAELLRFWVRKTSKSLLNLQNNGTTSAPWWWR